MVRLGRYFVWRVRAEGGQRIPRGTEPRVGSTVIAADIATVKGYGVPQRASCTALAPLYGRDFVPSRVPFASKALAKISVTNRRVSVAHGGVGSSQISLGPAALLRFAFPRSAYSSGVIPVPVGIAHTSTLWRYAPCMTTFGRLTSMVRSCGCVVGGAAIDCNPSPSNTQIINVFRMERSYLRRTVDRRNCCLKVPISPVTLVVGYFE